jgi:nucleoside 2-deoxyribosyltransferase
MKIFVLASYSSKVDYDSGEVFPEYKDWLEGILTSIEEAGHEVFCALRADQYKINDSDPASAFSLDMKQLEESDAILALLEDSPSTGVQTEIGVGVALKKIVILAHSSEDKLAYFNAAMLRAGVTRELLLPIDNDRLRTVLQ